jgi:hypothetical protein
VREEAEALEHHPDLRPLAGDRAFRVLDELPVAFPIADGVAVHLDPARVDPRRELLAALRSAKPPLDLSLNQAPDGVRTRYQTATAKKSPTA